MHVITITNDEGCQVDTPLLLLFLSHLLISLTRYRLIMMSTRGVSEGRRQKHKADSWLADGFSWEKRRCSPFFTTPTVLFRETRLETPSCPAHPPSQLRHTNNSSQVHQISQSSWNRISFYKYMHMRTVSSSEEGLLVSLLAFRCLNSLVDPLESILRIRECCVVCVCVCILYDWNASACVSCAPSPNVSACQNEESKHQLRQWPSNPAPEYPIQATPRCKQTERRRRRRRKDEKNRINPRLDSAGGVQ
ncbi:hypothetical protein J3F83DRAFT_723939 [Trichoderma novae-zelandiae]